MTLPHRKQRRSFIFSLDLLHQAYCPLIVVADYHHYPSKTTVWAVNLTFTYSFSAPDRQLLPRKRALHDSEDSILVYTSFFNLPNFLGV
jgi:hypothetical protein